MPLDSYVSLDESCRLRGFQPEPWRARSAGPCCTNDGFRVFVGRCCICRGGPAARHSTVFLSVSCPPARDVLCSCALDLACGCSSNFQTTYGPVFACFFAGFSLVPPLMDKISASAVHFAAVALSRATPASRTSSKAWRNQTATACLVAHIAPQKPLVLIFLCKFPTIYGV